MAAKRPGPNYKIEVGEFMMIAEYDVKQFTRRQEYLDFATLTDNYLDFPTLIDANLSNKKGINYDLDKGPPRKIIIKGKIKNLYELHHTLGEIQYDGPLGRVKKLELAFPIGYPESDAQEMVKALGSKGVKIKKFKIGD